MARVVLGLGLTTIALATSYMSCRPVDSKNELRDSFSVTLDTKQVSEVQKVVREIGRIEAAILEAKGISTATETDQVTASIRNVIKDKCTIDYVKDPAPSGTRHSYLRLSGTGCTLPASYDVNFKEDQSPGQYTMNANFSIQDGNLQTQNDIVEMTIGGDGRNTFTESQGNRNYSQSGTFQTISRGPIRYSSSLSESYTTSSGQFTSRGTRSFRFIFPQKDSDASFAAELRSEINIQGTTDSSRYYLNDSEISKQEFASYMTQLGLIAF